MYTLNGIGTTIYGRRYLTKKDLHSMGINIKVGNPYISTMWFVILFVPIIPLGSYIIFAEGEEAGSAMSSSKQYHMVKINLNWNQVLKTWAVPIFIIFIIWLLIKLT
jgi:hypothetical protein